MPNPVKAEEILATVRNENFETIAETLTPPLHRWYRHPQNLVKFLPDAASYFKTTMAQTNPATDLPELQWGKDDDFVLDFGIHMVGYLSFRLNYVGQAMDAPCRLRLTFGESPLDVTMSMTDVKTWISTSWLPDEVINVDFCPTTVSLPRRYAFRFLRVQVVDTSPKYKVTFSDMKCQCTSAVDPASSIENIEFSDPLLRDVDLVGIFTLRECMQTVFEDGPRRDRRLWIGDLRLQALTNYATFKDYDLVKRCLYLFAAVPRADGSLPACVFEKPSFIPSTDYIVDYDALFAATVYDYVVASNDLQTGNDLWSTVQSCLRRPLSYLDPKTGTFDPKRRSDGWLFLDWAQDLDHSAGGHGLLLFCLKAADGLARLLGKAEEYTTQIASMTAGAIRFLDASNNTLISADEKDTQQISHASAAWLTLSGAFPPDIARACILTALSHPSSVKPLTPYLWHYVAEALANLGCYQECIDLIKRYWGAMIAAGADTFWEAFDPANALASPYGDARNNSYCHAWSCTTSYLLRDKLATFVDARRMGLVAVQSLDEQWIARTQSKLG